MFDQQRTIDSNGILSQARKAYVPPKINVTLPKSIKPDANHINVDKEKAAADARYAEQQRQQAEQQSGGKIICQRYHQLGILDDDLNALDQAYGAWLMKTNPKWQKAYWRYARHIVKHLHRDNWKNRLLLAVLTPLVKVWAQEMGHRMGGNYRHSAFGSVLMWCMVHFFMALGDIRNIKLRTIRAFSGKIGALINKLTVFSQC